MTALKCGNLSFYLEEALITSNCATAPLNRLIQCAKHGFAVVYVFTCYFLFDKSGNIESIKLLVKAGADVNAIDKDGLSGTVTVIFKNPRYTAVLLLCTCKINFPVRVISLVPALHCASSRGHSHCIEEMKKLGAEVNLADKNSCTPLFYAVTLGNKECTKALLKHGADPNHKDVRGRT